MQQLFLHMSFLCLTWDLMWHQVHSTDGVCIKHLVWIQDDVGIQFPYTENDQDGSKTHPGSLHLSQNCSFIHMIEFYAVFRLVGSSHCALSQLHHIACSGILRIK